MHNQESIRTAVFSAVDDFNQQLSKSAQIDKSLDAPLYGTAGKLQSLDFVAFIIEVEEKINTELGVDITITNEDLLSAQKSPFSTLGTLIQYLSELLEPNNQTQS